MKKLSIILLALLLMSACSQSPNNNENDNDTDTKVVEETEKKDSITIFKPNEETQKIFNIFKIPTIYDLEINNSDITSFSINAYIIIDEHWEKKELVLNDNRINNKLCMFLNDIGNVEVYSFNDNLENYYNIDSKLNYTSFEQNVISTQNYLDKDIEIKKGDEIIIFQKYGTNDSILDNSGYSNIEDLLNDENNIHDAGLILTIKFE